MDCPVCKHVRNACSHGCHAFPEPLVLFGGDFQNLMQDGTSTKKDPGLL